MYPESILPSNPSTNQRVHHDLALANEVDAFLNVLVTYTRTRSVEQK